MFALTSNLTEETEVKSEEESGHRPCVAPKNPDRHER